MNQKILIDIMIVTEKKKEIGIDTGTGMMIGNILRVHQEIAIDIENTGTEIEEMITGEEIMIETIEEEIMIMIDTEMTDEVGEIKVTDIRMINILIIHIEIIKEGMDLGVPVDMKEIILHMINTKVD